MTRVFSIEPALTASIESIFLVSYFLIIVCLSIYGIHRCYLLYLYSGIKPQKISVAKNKEPHPFVTVQLPVYNEMYVVERLIKAAATLDYPRDRLEIQVLDDSSPKYSDLDPRQYHGSVYGMVASKRGYLRPPGTGNFQ